jgi:oxygen-independent coproporphyrinogen-3 oxidase
MAGIYIHIPFCASRCIYCAFYSTTSLDLRQRYVDAVCREVSMRCANAHDINTIYLGGGTPSQLTAAQLHQLFETIYIYNNVSPDAEVTIEVNPDDVSVEFAAVLQQLPVNRISMGTQTFDDQRLRFLRRRHTSGQVNEAVARLRQAGIRNISVDLMYGFPDESLDDWEHDIRAALALGVEHLSAYCLSIEDGTPLHRMGITAADEETERRMYYTLIDRLEAAGFEHYEISNFARPGFRSRHNAGYWTGVPYLGLGAAAHSFDGRTRSWNVADIRQYIDAMERGERCAESETIEGDTAYNDLLTTALRTREGLDLSRLTARHRDYCLQAAQRFIDGGLLSVTSGSGYFVTSNGDVTKYPDPIVTLTRKGLFVSDMVTSGLMLVDD